MSFRRLVLIAVVSVCPCSFADQITLTNGDHLTGTIAKSDGKILTLKTELAGTVEIQWTGIKELISDEELAVSTSVAAQPYSGRLQAKEGTVTVTAANGATTTIPQSDIKSVRAADEVHPPLTRGWNGGVDLGLALTGGNSQTTTFSLAFNAERPTVTDKLSLYANSVYAKNNALGAIPSTTANNIRGGVRYDRNLTPRLFAFLNADFESNDLQDLNLRSIFGGGLGFHATRDERTTLDLLGGANYTRENYVTLTRNFAALTLGDEFTHKLGAGTLLTQKFFFSRT